MATTLRDVMTASPHTVGIDMPLATARKMMRDHAIRHLPVLDGGRLVGVLSERDVTGAESFVDVDVKTTHVGEAMATNPFLSSPDAHLAGVLHEMVRHNYGSVVVMEHGHVVGIFTTTDAMRTLEALEGRSGVATETAR